MIIEKIQVSKKTMFALVLEENGDLVIKFTCVENGKMHLRNSGSEKYIKNLWKKLVKNLSK